ncbi:putative regulator of Ras-like GTPase activity (Roadblock/LC7/MglB family) [Azospirillum fermentarium]|uniref:hypothetical protein n=1 Tax=Azospirillum fermentarium TaxID=1233114 RepID=UPI002225C179|nr:hypothetical protein [Azospirillum fermentarium]MCW2248193.1 putative regulator of Ras-like GTPase activity (Roadblock/LC7/MglB family) [Azospirillum fermentarium]
MIRKHREKFRTLLEESLAKPSDGEARPAPNRPPCSPAQEPHGALEFATLFFNGEVLAQAIAPHSKNFDSSNIERYNRLLSFFTDLIKTIEERIDDFGMGEMSRIVIDPKFGAIYFTKIDKSLVLMSGTGVQENVPYADADHYYLAEHVMEMARNP